MKTTKDPIKLAKQALLTGNRALAEFSHRNSPKKYTQSQLFAVLVIQQFYKLDYRGVIELIKGWKEMQKAIGLRSLPHYSTLCYAERRILKKKELQSFLAQQLSSLAKAA